MNDEGFNLVKSSLRRKKPTTASVERTVPTQEEVEELFSERITPETELPPMRPLFQMFGVPCFYRGELVADCGKAKSGKTFFLSIIMAACLTNKALALERLPVDGAGNADLEPLRVLWIDTEQSQQSTQEILRDRIIPFSEKNVLSAKDINSNFYAFNLRGLGFDKRQKMVEVAIRTINPDHWCPRKSVNISRSDTLIADLILKLKPQLFVLLPRIFDWLVFQKFLQWRFVK